MEQQSAFEETCERYLLGELSEAEREQFEESYFTDDSLFERFLAVKDELLDAYARGELVEEKRSRFARHFQATVPRRRHLAETQEFIRAVTAVSTKAAITDGATVNAPLSVTTPKSSWRQSLIDFFKLRTSAWQITFAALLLIALGGTWVFMRLWQQQVTRDEQAALKATPSPITALPTDENYNTAPDSDTADANQSPVNTNVAPKPASKNPANNIQSPANTNNQLPANTNTTPKPTSKSPANRETQILPAQIASIMLLPLASRDISEANTLRLNSATRAVRVRLAFKSDDYRNYGAALTTVAGTSVWQQKTLKVNVSGASKSVTLQFAPLLLSQQDYIVTLTGQTAAGQTETIGEYYFRVERSPTQNTPTQTPTP